MCLNLHCRDFLSYMENNIKLYVFHRILPDLLLRRLQSLHNIILHGKQHFEANVIYFVESEEKYI